MAKIASFRGYRFSPAQAGDLNKVVTQPYDKIDDAMREDYLKRSEYNIVRIIKGPSKPLDTPNDNQYTRAADYWKSWIEERVLVREAGPAIYPYTQEYVHEGKTFTRRGLIAMVALEDDKSSVKAHEHTLAGPKADRLKLLRATEANDGQIFMLYNDAANAINGLIDPELAGAAPAMEVRDDYGTIHRLFRLSRPGIIRDVQEAFEGFDLFIADGHHRYETALKYMEECRAHNWKPVGAESFDHRMMTLINMHDSGLLVLPTHRLVFGVNGFDQNRFLKGAAEAFDVAEFNDRGGMFAALETAGAAGKTAIGFAATGLNGFRLLTFNNPAAMDAIVGATHSAAWKRLDVAVLHSLLLEKLLGIDAAKLAAETNVHYVRSRDEVIDMLPDGHQAAFILNPTRVEQVTEVASAGEKMPQKSTDFFPKLLTGMVFMRMTIDKSMGVSAYIAEDA